MSERADMTLCEAVLDIARAAGREIMRVYGSEFSVEFKSDRSPLTEADNAAHALIVERLGALQPRLPVLSEESDPESLTDRRRWPTYWLVDPLDGTKEFIKRNGEFTVNIALVDGHCAVLGVVVAPALEREYFGVVGHGAYKREDGADAVGIRVASDAGRPVRVVGSRSHANPALAAYLEALGPHRIEPMGSSLKICLVAEGAADVYPRLGPTSEWDTAAAQAILESAGGSMIDATGSPLRYNRKDGLLNPNFVAFGDAKRDWLEPIRRHGGSEDRN